MTATEWDAGWERILNLLRSRAWKGEAAQLELHLFFRTIVEFGPPARISAAGLRWLEKRPEGAGAFCEDG